MENKARFSRMYAGCIIGLVARCSLKSLFIPKTNILQAFFLCYIITSVTIKKREKYYE